MNSIRSLLLAMAGSEACKRALTGLPVTRRVVARFIPGESLEDAVGIVRELGPRGIRATLNRLGENVADPAAAAAATDHYVEMVETIASQGLDSGISLKLTQLGLDLGTDIASENLGRVLAATRPHGIFVRIDMENSGTVDATLDVYRRHAGDGARGDGLGLVFQSYLRRCHDDVEEAIRLGAPIRLVKGAYAEPADVAYEDKRDVDRNFARILDRLAEPDAREAGVRVAVATHDESLVDHAVGLIRRHDLETTWEFQFLYGIRRDLQERVHREGLPLRIYVSFGPSWYPWFMRRLAERPANLGFFVRHLLR